MSFILQIFPKMAGERGPKIYFEISQKMIRFQ